MAKKTKNLPAGRQGKKKKRANSSKKNLKTKAVLKLKRSSKRKKAEAIIKSKTKGKRKIKTAAKTKSKAKEIQEMKEAKILVSEEPIKKTKIRIIGIGGGGGTIISDISLRIQKASFVAANTDNQALKAVGKKVIKFHFGQNLTQGLGTGMNANVGQESALQEKDKIAKLLDGQDLTVFVVALGGGTGSGAAPVFAKISHSLGNLNYGIFTLPFKFEGDKKMEIALESLKKIKPYLNAFSVIPNERVFRVIDKNTPLKDALSAVNKILTDSLEGLIETIYEPGLINIDFADFKTILEGQGRLAYLNTVFALKNETSRQDLINKAISCPLYPYGIRGAKSVLFNIAGEKDLELSEVNQISNTISDLVNKEAKIIFGVSQEKNHAGFVKITLLATGCALRNFQPEEEKPKLKENKFVSPASSPGVEAPAVSAAKTARIVKKESAEETKKAVFQKIETPMNEKRKKIQKNGKKEKKSEIKTENVVKRIIESKGNEEEIENTLSQQERVRKNAMQLKREIEEEEREIQAREQIWDTPAFLRQKKS